MKETEKILRGSGSAAEQTSCNSGSATGQTSCNDAAGANRKKSGGQHDRSAFEAEYILLEVLGKDRSWIFAHGDEFLDDELAARVFNAAERRTKGEPLQYIFRRADFMGYSLYVDERVLIPRQDTELMAEEALRFASFCESRGLKPSTLDLCTGSGALALVLAGRSSIMTASDISKDALEVAAINLKRYGVEAELVESDLFDSLDGRMYDLIVSNPPYIPAKVVDTLEPEVRDYEPRLALDGGDDGMDIIRRIIAGLKEHLSPGGLALIELGNGQGDAVQQLAAGEGFKSRLFKDFSGENRFICIGRDERSVSGEYTAVFRTP